MAGSHTPDPDELYRWLHGVEHAVVRRTGRPVSEASLTSECWGGYFAPSWAQRLADQGADPSLWCVQLSPHLRARQDSVEDELASLLQ